MYYIVNTLWELKFDCETIATVRTIYINNISNQKPPFDEEKIIQWPKKINDKKTNNSRHKSTY